MGWTSVVAKNYKSNGIDVDRKAECDEIFKWDSETNSYRLLKSSMVGSVYYGAVERKSLTDESDRTVFAVICLTSVNNSEYFNFSYKDMDETYGPAEAKCPTSILKLLTPTDNKFALSWRKRCEEYHNRKKTSANKLPIGTKIKVVINGNERILIKRPAMYQFKTPFWYDASGNYYVKKSMIPDNYEIID